VENKKKKINSAWGLLAVLVILWFVSCTKKPETIGLDLVDVNKPFIGYDTTMEVFAYSVVEDSVASDETSLNLFGSRYSPTFGMSNTSFYTHLRLSDLFPDFGPNPVVDSVVLTMVYSGYYGKISTMQTVRIYQVDDEISLDSTYWSNRSFNTLTEELAYHQFIPNPNDSIEVDSATFAPAQLRIPMNTGFAQDILDIQDSTIFGSSEDFINYFNGIHIVPDDVFPTNEVEGATLYFNMTDEQSDVKIYYHNDTSTVNDTLIYVLSINSNSARVGRFLHNYKMSIDNNFRDQIVNKDTTLGKNNFYIQGMGGIKTIIKFPGLSNWVDSGNIVINEAKLVLTATGFEEDTDPPESLILFKLTDEEGQHNFVPDYLRGEAYFGGSLNTTNNDYFFRISRHIQQLLRDEPDLGLVMYPTGKSIRANEAIFIGSDALSPGRFRLNILYTKVD